MIGLWHHYAISGTLWNWPQVMHHETIIIFILAFLAGLWWPRQGGSRLD